MDNFNTLKYWVQLMDTRNANHYGTMSEAIMCIWMYSQSDYQPCFMVRKVKTLKSFFLNKKLNVLWNKTKRN